jgi:hypothetical protein
MAQRVYKQATIFNARIVGMRNLWEPSREYMGKPTEKPNYLASIIVAKTRGHWSEEPAFAGFAQAAQELYQSAMTHIPFPAVMWPIKDGDSPEPGRTPAEWMRGHWFLTGSSSSPIETNIVQGGVPVKITNRAIVKPGDFVAAGVALAVNSNNHAAVKCYMNSILFLSAGEEIAVGSSITGAELMAKAKEQGLNVTGYGAGAPAGGFGQFGAGAGSPPMTGGALGLPAPGTPGATVGTSGFAPPPAQPPASTGGFAAPTGFTPPQGFPPR